MSLKLVDNPDLDLSFLRENLTKQSELKLVHPEAKLPFDEHFWLKSFGSSKQAFSLLLELDGTTIGHAALKKTSGGKIVLFFVLVAKGWRGKGYGRALIREIDLFIEQNLTAREYYLNVLPKNAPAIGLYKATGFEIVSRSVERVKMRKKLA